MAFIHGKKTAVFLGEYDFSPVLREASVTASANPVDVTTFADAGSANLKVYGQGLSDGSISISGMWSNSDLDPDVDASRTAVAPDEQVKAWEFAGTEFPCLIARNTTATTAAPSGILVPDLTPCTMITGLVESWNASSPVNDVVALDAEIMGASTSTNVVGGTPMLGYSICHNYADSDNTTATSTPLVWNSESGAKTTSWVQVSGTNANDYGAVISVHVLDNTMDQNVAITIQHNTADPGTPAEFGTDLLWPTSGRLVAGAIGSKSVAYNPGTNNTDGYWRLTCTPAASASGELSIIAAVCILNTQLFT